MSRLLQGKFFDIDLYETPFRRYDATTGRFTGVDAMAEETMHLTPYQFGLNSQIIYNDPTGLLSGAGEAFIMIREYMKLGGSIDEITVDDQTVDGISVGTGEGGDYFCFMGLDDLSDEDVMNTVCELTNSGHFTAAALFILTAYPKAFNVDKDKFTLLQDIEVTEGKVRDAFVTREYYLPNKGIHFAELIFPVSSFTTIAKSKDLEYYKYTVNLFFHEFIHIKTYFGLEGIEQIHQTPERAKEREFIAFYYQLLHPEGIPKLNDFWTSKVIETFHSGRYFESFNQNQKEKYINFYNQILELQKKLNP